MPLTIKPGKLPDITGASGPPDHEVVQGIDPVTTRYIHRQVEDGVFRLLRNIPGSFKEKKEPDMTTPDGTTAENESDLSLPVMGYFSS